MPRLMTTCSTTGAEVATGYRTQDFDISQMTEPRAFRCPCGVIHSWGPENAYVEEGLTPAGLRAADQSRAA